MKVALYGNTCNTFFALARAIRRVSDVDVHVFIDDDADFHQQPEAEQKELRGAYPSWIHKGRYHSVAARFWPGSSPLVKELDGFDVALVSGGGVRYAPFVDCPFVFFTTGWDFTVAPFPIRFIRRNPGVVRKAAHVLGGFWQRRGIAAIAKFWSQPVPCFLLAAERLGLDPAVVTSTYLPVPLDTDRFAPPDDARTLAATNPHVRQMLDGHDFVVFHPCSIEMRQTTWTVDTGQWRGSERFFEGFARFVKSNPTARPVLVLIDKGDEGVAAARRLFHTWGVEKHVLWLKGPRTRGFDRADIIPFYAVADVVAEDFGVGWFGATTIEGLSMGKPVLCYVKDEAMKQMYPWHPILAPHTPDEVATCLTELLHDPAGRRKRGELGRKWAIEFHSFDAVAARYIEQLRAVVAG